jgi:RNA polymerase sigma-70 factor (ECF subfamily)
MGRFVATPAVKDARALGWSDVGADEADLLRRCAAGDEVACAELVTTHERMVYQLAFHLLGTREEALDLSQEVFLRVFRMIGTFRGQSSLRTWIYRIVINQARNRQHVETHGELPQRADVAAPDRLLARKEAAARLWRAMDRLPFDQRTAVVLREFDGLSYEEIAFSLGIAVGTVKSRLTRARQALRADLVEDRT